MSPNDDLFTSFSRTYESRRQAEMPLADYLKGCRSDPMMYASAPERLLSAIGAPTIIDTAQDQRLGRSFRNRSEAHTSELQSLMRHSYPVFCFTKKPIDLKQKTP